MVAVVRRMRDVLRGTILPLATLVLVAGIAVGVEGAGLGSLAALASGVAAGVLAAGGLAWWRERQAAAEQARAEEAAARARHEAAWRLFWEASSDFLPGAWARRDLETLRLLTLNLGPGGLLGDRLARRLRDAVSRVLAGPLDRLGDLLVTGRQLASEHRALEDLEAAIPRLVDQLEGVRCEVGEVPPFDPAIVAEACSAALDACDALRRELGRRVMADLRAAIAWLGRDRFPHRVESGELVLPGRDAPEVPAGSGRLLVVARAPDLVSALAATLERIFAHGDPVGPVRVAIGETDDGGAGVSISWQAADRIVVEPRKIGQPLQLLRAYGADVRIEEEPRRDRIALVCELETVEATGPDVAAAGADRA